jgi:hypothetical protein
MQHEPTLSLINGQWFICYAVDTITPTPTQSDLVIALDPGVRTFMTGFDGQNVLELGRGDIGRIYRLARHMILSHFFVYTAQSVMIPNSQHRFFL